MRRLVLLLAGCGLLVAGCGGARPQQAVGVSRGPVVHYLLCQNDLVQTVRLTAPGGRVLWQIDSAQGSTRTDYPVGKTPPGFTRVVPYRGLAAKTWVSGPDGREAMSFAPASLPASGVLRGDGAHLSAAGFQQAGSGYCGTNDYSSTYALAAALVALLAVLAWRFLRGRLRGTPTDPYR